MSPLSIVITIVVIVLLYMLIKYIFTDPYTLLTTQDGKTASTISASSLATNGTDVPSSNFAYSIWFYVNNWNYRYGEQKVIFGRMGAPSKDGSGYHCCSHMFCSKCSYSKMGQFISQCLWQINGYLH